MDILNDRYRIIDVLGEGGMGIVYRVYDRLTSHDVALKRIRLIPGTGLADSINLTITNSDLRLAIAREFKVLASLKHPHIITVLDYGFDANLVPYFTMPLLENAVPILHATLDRPLEARIQQVIQILQALAYMHRRGILHRDLKPSNILVVGDNLQLIDFGLAVQTDTDQDQVGTITFMAPELFEGKSASIASDLYAVGLLAYGIFADNYPFDTAQSITGLIKDILYKAPNLSNLPMNLVPFIKRLLEKDPQKRFSSAYHALVELCDCLERPLPAESESIRDSFLQSAAFTGRDFELSQLAIGLERLLRDGQGSGWLVGGESGVGKSRLLDELRTNALVDGVIVVRGQAVDEGHLPFHAWRDVLPRLILATPPTTKQAAILKELVPNIGQLLNRKVPNAPDIGGQDKEDRLVYATLDLLKRQQHPVLILLEDIQWSQETLIPLNYFFEEISRYPVMIVASYRHDERPELVELLGKNTSQILLKRLDENAIAHLSQSMLGPMGATPEIIEFLYKQTEGNVFFLVEVMRALAEEAGRLSNIDPTQLPQTVSTGGLMAIIDRRLKQIPAHYQPLMKLVAVIGRRVDMALLTAIFSTQTVLQTSALGDLVDELTHFMELAESTMIFEWHKQGWRFAHDKFRETILGQLSDDERIHLHKTVAEAIETHYGDHLSDYAEILLNHWRMARNIDKALFYTYQAAERLITYRASYERAIGLLQDAFAFTQDPLPVHDSISLWRMIADAYERMGDYDTADTYYKQSGEIALAIGDQAALSRIYIGRTQIAYRQARLDEAEALASQSLALCEAIDDQWGLAYSFNNLGDIAYFRGNYEEASDYFQLSIGIRRSINDIPGISSCLSNLGIIAIQAKKLDEAEAYFSESLELCESNEDAWGTGIGFSNLGNVARLRGDYAKAESYQKKSLAMREAIGNRLGYGICLHNLGEIALAQQSYKVALDYYQQSIDIKRLIGDRMGLAVSLAGVAQSAYMLGHMQSAYHTLQESLGIAHDLNSARLNPRIIATAIVLSALHGQSDQARRWLSTLAGHTEEHIPTHILQQLQDLAMPDVISSAQAIEEALEWIESSQLNKG